MKLISVNHRIREVLQGRIISAMNGEIKLNIRHKIFHQFVTDDRIPGHGPQIRKSLTFQFREIIWKGFTYETH